MKEMQRKGRMLMAQVVVLLAVLFNCQGADAIPAHHTSRQPQSAVVAAQKQHHREAATLTDASHLYRICSSRPQRVNPTQGSKTERTGNSVWRNFVKPLYTFYDSRRRQVTAPFCLSVSRDYYVIALRHIIR